MKINHKETPALRFIANIIDWVLKLVWRCRSRH